LRFVFIKALIIQILFFAFYFKSSIFSYRVIFLRTKLIFSLIQIYGAHLFCLVKSYASLSHASNRASNLSK